MNASVFLGTVSSIGSPSYGVSGPSDEPISSDSSASSGGSPSWIEEELQPPEWQEHYKLTSMDNPAPPREPVTGMITGKRAAPPSRAGKGSRAANDCLGASKSKHIWSSFVWGRGRGSKLGGAFCGP